jgi:hypothetical protein
MTRIARFNEQVAVILTRSFGSMWTAYLFLVMSLVPVIPGLMGLSPIVMYISTTIIQLVALPLLAVGQQVLGRDHERIIREMHAGIKAELVLAKEERAHMHELLGRLGSDKGFANVVV